MINEANKENILFSSLFNRKLELAPPEIKIAFKETIDLFLEDQFHAQLRNHPLTDQYAGIRSIDVTADWRALYREKGDRIIFVELGTHVELYGQ